MPFRPDVYRLPASEIARVQGELLQETIRRTALTSPFYRDRFSASGVDPSGVKTPADLARLPLTSREDLQRRSRDAWAVPRERVAEIVATTGTTGEPLYVAMTRSDLERLGRTSGADSCGWERGRVIASTSPSPSTICSWRGWRITSDSRGSARPPFAWARNRCDVTSTS